MDNSPPVKHLGSLDADSTQAISQAKKEKQKSQDEIRVELAQKEKPPLSRVLNAREMEEVATKILSHKAWAFFASASDDCVGKCI